MQCVRNQRARLLNVAALPDLAEAELRFGAKTDNEQPQLLALELAHFVESVAEARQPKVGAALGKSALEVAIAITEQIRAATK